MKRGKRHTRQRERSRNNYQQKKAEGFRVYKRTLRPEHFASMDAHREMLEREYQSREQKA